MLVVRGFAPVEPHLTQVGQRMSRLTGVRAIMKDIVETLRAGDGSWINLSAGNPVILPEIVEMWRDCTRDLLRSDEFGTVICRYGASQGYEPLIEAIAADFNTRY
ncbi:MAG: valine--pyruvate transaminase, partial [Cyanobacteria bacterium J06648_11]